MFEKVIAKRCLLRYYLHKAVHYVLSLQHVIVYAKDLLLLNAAAQGPEEGVLVNDKHVHLLPIAPLEGCKEVGQLEGNRAKILEGMRDGARRVFQLFLPAMNISYEEFGETFVNAVLPEEILSQKFLADEYEAFIVSQHLRPAEKVMSSL